MQPKSSLFRYIFFTVGAGFLIYGLLTLLFLFIPLQADSWSSMFDRSFVNSWTIIIGSVYTLIGAVLIKASRDPRMTTAVTPSRPSEIPSAWLTWLTIVGLIVAALFTVAVLLAPLQYGAGMVVVPLIVIDLAILRALHRRRHFLLYVGLTRLLTLLTIVWAYLESIA
jgi:hypothetical protein